MALCLLARIHRHVAAEACRAAPRPARNARRLPAALTTPEPVSFSTIRSIAPSMSVRRNTSSQIMRPSGLAQSMRSSVRIAWRAMRSPTKRGRRRLAAPGMMPSLRAGSVRYASSAASDVVDRQQDLAVAADREALDRGDPDFLDEASSGDTFGQSEAAVELVDQAEIADQVPEVADLALVEVREVDAGAEQPPPGVLRCARQHRRAARRPRSCGSSSARSTAISMPRASSRPRR